MTIKDLAKVQSAGIDIKVVETGVDGKTVEKASFNSNYYNIITEEFLSQEIASMTVRKTNGQNVYIEIVAASETAEAGADEGEVTGDGPSLDDLDGD